MPTRPCLHFVLEADCKSAKDSSMNWPNWQRFLFTFLCLQKSIRLKGSIGQNRPVVQQSLYDISFTKEDVKGRTETNLAHVPSLLMIPRYDFFASTLDALKKSSVLSCI